MNYSKVGDALNWFEKAVLFEVGTLAFDDHRNVYRDHMKYTMFNLAKPKTMKMVEYINRVQLSLLFAASFLQRRDSI